MTSIKCRATICKCTRLMRCHSGLVPIVHCHSLGNNVERISKVFFCNIFLFWGSSYQFFFKSLSLLYNIWLRLWKEHVDLTQKKASSAPTPSTLTQKKVKKARNLSWSQCVKVQFLKSRKNFEAYIVGNFGNKQHDLMAWHINSVMLSRARPYIVK